MRSLAFLVLALGALSAPGQLASNLTVAIGSGTAVVRWSGATTVKYRVERISDAGVTWKGIDAPTTAFTETNLLIDASSATNFRVAKWSNAYPRDTARPAAPSNVRGTAPSCGQVTLSWRSVTDSGTSASGTSEYLIYRGGAFLKSVPHTSGVATFSTSDTNVSGLSDYSYQIAAMDRAGNVSVRSTAVSVRPPACPCNYAFSPAVTPRFDAVGGTAVLAVSVGSNCTWTATSGQSWIHTASSGSGNGAVNYSVDANSSTSLRTGTLSVGGQTFTVNQAGIICSYTLSASSGSHTAAVESGSFGVTAQAGCGWNATANQTWIHTTSFGSGSGTVGYTVDVNSSPNARAGTISVSGQTFSVNQTGITCGYALNVSGGSHPPVAASGSFGVIVSAGCSWSATAGQAWIHTTSTGSGNGAVNYTVDANSSTNARSGLIAVNDQSFTVSQAGNTTDCNYVLNPVREAVSNVAGSGSFAVTATAGCIWSATADQVWIHTTNNGSGSGTVDYTFDGNGSPNVRSGTISVNGQAFTLSQAAANPPDSAPPKAVFLAPGLGATLNGQVSLLAQLTDDVSVASVSFYFDDGQWVLVGMNSISGTLCTNGMLLDTTLMPNGPHTLLCVVSDTAGNADYAILGVAVANASCSYVLTPSSGNHAAGSESGSFGVTAQAGCAWSAAANQTWIHTTSAGSGDGTVSYTVDANASPVARTGTITVRDQVFAVSQAGIICSYTLTSSNASHLAAADSGSFGMTATTGCSWSATAAPTWIHVTSTGSGNGAINYTVDANRSTNARFGTISVSGQSFTVNQAGLVCSYTLSSASGSHTAAAEVGTFNVAAAAAGCTWSAAPNQPWIHTTSSANGDGPVSYTVDANSSTSARSGWIAVNGQNFTVNQEGAVAPVCNVVLNPANGNQTAAVGSGSFEVAAALNCSWSAKANQTWIHTTSSGMGNGTASYTVDGNGNTNSRSGTITVNGQAFTVNQAGATVADIEPPVATLLAPNPGDTLSGSVSLTALLTDNMSLASVVFYYDQAGQWVGVGTNALSGPICTNSMLLDTALIPDGPHTLLCVVYDPAGNAGYAFLGVTVANAILICNYVLDSPGANLAAESQSGSFGVAVTAGCVWSTVASQTWIHTISTGSGNGSVGYTVDANSSTNSRSGAITVAGQNFAVNQAGIICNYALNPTSGSHPAAAASGSFGVTAAAGCDWIAAASHTWIRTASGGNGNGTVIYTVDANSNTNARSGSISVNGQDFTVDQVGNIVIACNCVLSPASVSFTAAAGSGSFGVTAAVGCSWSATANQVWIHTTSTGSGNGTVSYAVDGYGNTIPRSGTIMVNGQTFTVNQAGADVLDAVPPVATFLVPNAGDTLSGSVSLTALLTDDVSLASVVFYYQNAGEWVPAATVEVSGPVVTNVMLLDTTRMPDGAYTLLCMVYDTAGNAGYAMQLVSVANSCSYTLDLTSADYGSGSQSGGFGVIAPTGCSWSATASQTWIHTISTGSGNGSVGYTVDANDSPSLRSGVIAVGSQMFTINQEGRSCSYSLNPLGSSHTAAAESGSFGVTAQAGCTWSATTTQTWLHTTSSGNGAGTVAYTVDTNVSTTARSGTLTVGGQVFNVTQAGSACLYALGSASGSHTAAAESGSFGVTAQAGCTWSATTTQTWLHTTSSGNGAGTVAYTVDASSSTAARSGTITVGGQVFTVNQAGNVICNCVLNSTSGSPGADAGSRGSFAVAAQPTCSWSAMANQIWIHTMSSGTGNGTVSYVVDGNGSTTPRSGSISVNGQTFNVNQAGALFVDPYPPFVAFLAPLPGAVLSGTISIQTLVTDNVSVARSEFYVDNAGTWILLVTAPCSGLAVTNTILLDTTIVPNGSHSLMCLAYDTAGNFAYDLLGVSIANVVPDPGFSRWLKEAARTAITGEAVGRAVKADSQGNIIVVGNFKGSVTFGNITNISYTALGGSDIFICKFATNGILLQAKTFGGNLDDNVTALAMDASDNIFITGYFVGTSDFGGGSMTSDTGVYGCDVFVAKYDSVAITNRWSKHIGGSFGNNSSAGIAVDPVGDVIVGGSFYMDVNLGDGSRPSQANSLDGFVAKYDGGDGHHVWSRVVGGILTDWVKAVAVDSLGDVVVVGYGYGSMDFGGGFLPSFGSSDLFIAKYAGTNGSHLWSHVFGGVNPDSAEGVAVDSHQNIFVTGTHGYTVDFGGASVTAPIDTGVYLAKYNSGGNLQWAHGFGSETANGGVGARAVAVDSAGNVAITGNASGGVDFGSGVLTFGEVNFYVAKYDGTGGYLWAKRSGNFGGCSGYGIAIDEHINTDNNKPERNVLATGSIQGDVVLDGMPASSPANSVKSAFLVKISP